MTLSRKQITFGAVGLIGLGAGLGGLTIFSGGVNVAGTDQHTAPVRWLLRTTMERSVRSHARGFPGSKRHSQVSGWAWESHSPHLGTI